MSKLLLVDDDANTLASLARAFRLAGHEAVVCDQVIKAPSRCTASPVKAPHFGLS